MRGESIYAIAYEMLETTNIFEKDISQLHYSKCGHNVDEVSFLDLLKRWSKIHDHRYCGKSEENLRRAFSVISGAMDEYINGYPASFSFRQRTKRNFKKWLERIISAYNLTGIRVSDELKSDETDTGIAMLKLLHARDGVTYEDFRKELGITDRAIHKNLVKLSPSLYTRETPLPEQYSPLRLGGQPLLADIELVDETEISLKEKRFRTLNSIHPLVLQENIVQLATLLKALCYQYYDRSDEVGVLIAIDIWSQMSEYARMKIKNYYAFDNPDLTDFIVMLEDECPDDHASKYRTEKEMRQDIEMPIEDALPFLAKAPGRKATIILSDGIHIRVQQLHQTVLSDGRLAYQALDTESVITTFSRDQVTEVIFE